MPSDRALQRFRDIVDNIERIVGFTADMDLDGFAADDRTRLAVERCLSIISEAAVKLGSEAERRCPGLPWADIRGIGNRLRHGYDQLDTELVWNTVLNDLDGLHLACMAQLEAP